MHDSDAVRLVERPRDLREHLHDDVRMKRTDPLDELLEIASLQELHHEKWRAPELGGHVRVRDAHHVLALDLRTGAGLAFEPRDGRRIHGRRSVQHFERELLAGVNVLDHVDDAHASTTELADDPIAGGDEFDLHGGALPSVTFILEGRHEILDARAIPSYGKSRHFSSFGSHEPLSVTPCA